MILHKRGEMRKWQGYQRIIWKKYMLDGWVKSLAYVMVPQYKDGNRTE